MLLQLLTLLLPVRVPEPEIAFHHDLVLNAYRDYHRRLEATGYRDRGTLRKLEKKTAYSMEVLKKAEPKFWQHICQYRNRAWTLKTMSKSQDIIPEP